MSLTLREGNTLGALLHELEHMDQSRCDALLLEAGQCNHVRVVVHRARALGKRIGHDGGTLVHDSRRDGDNRGVGPRAPMLLALDSLRAAWGLKPRWLPELIALTGGELVSVTKNIRLNTGIDLVASALGDSSGSRAAVPQYIALSNNTVGTSATHTSATTPLWGTAQAADAAASTSTGEYTVLGVARALATYAHTGAATSWTQAKTFTATGTVTALDIAALFNGSSQGAGTGFTENTFTATSLANNDQLTITWTLND